MCHIIVFAEYDVKGRRPGKRLRNVIRIVTENEGGMLGRLELCQVHSYEKGRHTTQDWSAGVATWICKM